MKKTSMLAMALAALAIGGAQANTLYIGGSSAFRKTAYAALTGAGWTASANDGVSLTDAGGTHILYTNASGDTISTCWSGSEAGVQSVVAGTNNRPLAFFSTNALGAGKSTLAAAGSITTNADAAFSDCSAAISRWNGKLNSVETINGQTVIANYTTPASEQTVGIQAFTFVASENFPTNKATGISANAAKVLFEKGVIPLSLITGSTNDANSFCWLTGRNPDSGTRITAFNEVGYGALKSTMNYQIMSNSGGQITQIQPWPSANINGLVTALGDSGQSSGGTLVGSIGPVASTLNVVQATITYATNAVTNTTYTTNYPTNAVVTTNVTTAYQPRQTNVPVYTTNYTTSTNYAWTNSPITNKVYVSYNQPYTNPAKDAASTFDKYKQVNKKVNGFTATNEYTLVSAPVLSTSTNKGKVTTNVTTPAVFSVNEYYNDVLATNWVQVPTVSTTTNVVQTGSTSQTVYVQVGITNLTTNYVVSDTPVITSQDVVSSVVTPTATNLATSTVTADANYMITYASVSDAISKSTLSSNYPVVLNYNGDGIGAYPITATLDQTTAKNTIQAKIKNGSYTFWNFEQAELSPNASAGAQSVFAALVSSLNGKVSAPNANPADMNVNRTSDGATVYSK